MLLDLAQAYGSVHHSLIYFSLLCYHNPRKFQKLIQSFYSGIEGKVWSETWETQIIPQDIGVFQGHPLSVVLFNTVINTG